MFPCGMCGFQSISAISVIRHTVKHHKYDANFLVTCKFDGCQSSYTNWASFRSHISRKHQNEDIHEAEDEPMQEEIGENRDNFPPDEEIHDAENPPFNPVLQQVDPIDVRGQYVTFMQHIREGCNLSQKATDVVSEGIVAFSDDTLVNLKARLLQSADENGKISAATIEEEFSATRLATLVEDVNTKYLLDKYLQKSGFLIMPQSVHLDDIWIWVKKPRLHLARKAIQFYEVPFFPLLQQLLNEDDILNCIDNPRTPQVDGLLRDYQDGEYVKAHPIFGTDPTSLKIILYYDDVEIANPLGSKVKSHKLALFYWTIGNIYPEFRSTLKVVNLLCVVKTIHLRKYGINKILENFVRDIKILESPEGKVFSLKGVDRQFRGSLLMFTGDTLAANYVGGFKEGVAFAKKPCRSCLGTAATIKTHFKESDFVLRDKVTHVVHCDAVDEPALTKEARVFWSKQYGVNGKSVLCEIDTFDITKCLVQDLMHVVIEGVLELELRHFLKWVIDNHHMKLKTLNRNIVNFNFEHLSKDKPSPIEPSHLLNKLRQNCAQLITLGNALPFLLDDCVEDDDERLQNLILILQILNGMLAFETTVDDITLIKKMIEMHHTRFVALYREPTPKFHFMVHMPAQMLLFGPCRHAWCMRFEGAHCRFKHLATVVKSFKNICLTLSYRHQSSRCAELFKFPNMPSKKVLYRGDVVSPGKSLEIGNHQHALVIGNCLNVQDNKIVLSTKEITVKGTSYTIGRVLLLKDDEDDLPQFGVVIDIVVIDAIKVLIFKELETLFFVPINNLYKVRVMHNVFGAIRVDRLLHPHPLSMFVLRSGSYVLLLNHRRNEYF